MKKIFSYVLIFSLALTMVIPVMSSQTSTSLPLSENAMLDSIGGATLACAGVLLGTGIIFIAAGASGPIGWAATWGIIGGGISAISASCGG